MQDAINYIIYILIIIQVFYMLLFEYNFEFPDQIILMN